MKYFLAGIVTLLLIVTPAGAVDFTAQYTEDDISNIQPDDKIWKSIEPASVSLVKQQMVVPRGGGFITSVEVKSLYSDKHVAFHVTWADPTKDDIAGIDSFRDAVALQFPVNPTENPPSPFMGDKANPVNIWQWRADWQRDLDGKDNGIDEVQPLQAGLWISPLDKQIIKKKFPRKGSNETTVREHIAAGWGTLTTQKHQDVDGTGIYEDGKWSVVFRRALDRQDESDADFIAGKNSFINFAVWDGKSKDVNGMKSVSMMWNGIKFGTGKPVIQGAGGHGSTEFFVGVILVLITIGAMLALLFSVKSENRS